MGLGKMKVFISPEAAPPGFLRKGQDTTKELAEIQQLDFYPATVTKYFELFYSTLPSFDVKDIMLKLSKDAHEMKIQFRTAARDFKLIDDSYSQSIIVWYENAKANSLNLIDLLSNRGPERWLLRKLQRFTVSVPEREFQFYRDQGMVEEIHGFWIQNTQLLYQKGFGVVGQNPNWDGDSFIY
jgi:CRISPR-associated endonuclease/helicase Cas3